MDPRLRGKDDAELHTLGWAKSPSNFLTWEPLRSPHPPKLNIGLGIPARETCNENIFARLRGGRPTIVDSNGNAKSSIYKCNNFLLTETRLTGTKLPWTD